MSSCHLRKHLLKPPCSNNNSSIDRNPSQKHVQQTGTVLLVKPLGDVGLEPHLRCRTAVW